MFDQIFDVIDMGLVIADKELKVRRWNRWMECHSGISAGDIVGTGLVESFPNLDNPNFLRNVKAILAFGNLSIFSRRLHEYLFPFKLVNSFESKFEFMQQSCNMGPLRNEAGDITHIYITVQDVTDVAAYEQQLIEMNHRDGLTGIYNRRFFDYKLKEEFHRHRRYKRPLSLIIFDIDFFKKVNDTYGHQGGDFVLKEIAAVVGGSIRETDFLARYGGEEFCCLLPETPKEAAVTLAERLRKKVQTHEMTFEDTQIKVTISLGVSATGIVSENPDVLIQEADAFLYEAKKRGRNRVVAERAEEQRLTPDFATSVPVESVTFPVA